MDFPAFSTRMVDCPYGVLLLVCGPPACGKTHLVKEIVASDSSSSDSPCAFVSLSFDQLYPRDTRKNSIYSDLSSRVSACDTLVATDHFVDYPYIITSIS